VIRLAAILVGVHHASICPSSYPGRPSLVTALARGLVTGPLLFEFWPHAGWRQGPSESLVIHQFARWLMAVAGALIGLISFASWRRPGPIPVVAVALSWHGFRTRSARMALQSRLSTVGRAVIALTGGSRPVKSYISRDLWP
jgi:hypothetical protein